MTLLPQLKSVALVASAAFLLSGCAPMKVNSYLERGATFDNYRTYAWAPVEQFSTGDPRLDNNPFFQERLVADVDAGLAALGYEKSASPDLELHYHAAIRQEVDVTSVDRGQGYQAREDRVFVYEAGTLGLDFVDAQTNRLVWRGWVEANMEGAIDDQAWMEQQVDRAIARLLEELPRKQ